MIVIVDAREKVMFINNENIMLTNKEFLFCQFMIKSLDKDTVSTTGLITHVWGGREQAINQNNLSQLAHKVRAKLTNFDIMPSIKVSLKHGCSFHLVKKPIIIEINSRASSKLMSIISK